MNVEVKNINNQSQEERGGQGRARHRTKTRGSNIQMIGTMQTPPRETRPGPINLVR